MLVHPIMALNKHHKKILILGGGDGLALRELEKYKDINEITLVDLDPGMIKFSSTNKYMKKINKNSFKNSKITILNNKGITSNTIKDIYANSKRKGIKDYITTINVINIDADKFLHFLKNKKYDIIIIDFPDPSSIELAKLYTKEFFLKIKKVMNKNTIGIIQSTSPYHAKESFLCILRTIRSTMLNAKPIHLNIPSFGDWGWIIFSKKDFKDLNKEIKKIHFNIKTDYLTPDIFKKSFIFGKKELITKDKRINTLMNPILLQIYTKNSWLFY